MTKEELAMVKRLRFTVGKLAGWNGYDINDLIEDGYLKEGDLG